MSGLNLLNQYIALRGIDIVSKGDIPQIICDQVFAGLIEYDETLDKILEVIVQDELSQKTPSDFIQEIEKMILQNVQIPQVTYEVLNKIGSGGFGVVYKALSSKGDLQALKVYNAPFSESGIRETSFSRIVSHPNVVSMKDYFFGSDRIFPVDFRNRDVRKIYAVMDIATGDLQKMAGKIKDPLCPILQILCGIHAIHSVGLVHSDIKPENILLFGDVFKVSDLDFFIPTEGHKYQIGTQAFWSPEKSVSYRNSFSDDVWAAGITFIEMITNNESLVTYLSTQREIDNEVNRIEDPQIRTLILGMLRKNPQERWTIEKCVGYMHSMCIEENHEPQKAQGNISQEYLAYRAKALNDLGEEETVTLVAASIIDRYIVITHDEDNEDLIDTAFNLSKILHSLDVKKIENYDLAIDIIQKLEFKLYIQTQSILNLRKNGSINIDEALKRPQLQEVKPINYKIDSLQLFGIK